MGAAHAAHARGVLRERPRQPLISYRAQLLSGPPARTPEAVCARLLAVQAQDPRGFRLAVRARCRPGLTVADVEKQLNNGTLVVTWLNRGTLHLVRAVDYPLLQFLTTPPQLTANTRRLAQEDVTEAQADRAVAAVARAVSGGPQTRRELREVVARSGARVDGQALVHVLFLAALRGVVVRGPMVGGEQAYVSAPDWLPSVRPPRSREAALAELASRYLRGHAPADDRDLAKWAGLPLRDARAALSSVRRPRTPPVTPPPPRLLGAWDALLCGWASRSAVTGAHDAAVVSGGLFRPFALVDGVAVATWSLDRGRVALAPFTRISSPAMAALEDDARDVERFLAVRSE